LVEARTVLTCAEAAELVLAELGDMKRGTLAVQAIQTIANYWLPRHLVAFHRAHPGINLRLTIGNTAQVVTAVREVDADIGFVGGIIDDPLLAIERVARDQLVIVVGVDHPWVAVGRLDPNRPAETEWVLREPGSGTRAMFEAALKDFGVPPDTLRITLELPSNEAVRSAVEAGIGATAISASVAAPGLEAGLLHHIQLDLPERAFYVVHHQERHRSKTADALLAMMSQAH
jgi:DNA-binding transcriptional LysR family regulator